MAMAEIDPVCGRQVEKPTEELTFHHKRQRYHFCSERCLKAFERRVEKERLQELARAGALLSNGRVRWGLA
ncbi:MAG: YHS domain-containing protein [Myxococcaceae bacterium]|nr:YHS domain-containing protein [Myxococcaceae bacterium]